MVWFSSQSLDPANPSFRVLPRSQALHCAHRVCRSTGAAFKPSLSLVWGLLPQTAAAACSAVCRDACFLPLSDDPASQLPMRDALAADDALAGSVTLLVILPTSQFRASDFQPLVPFFARVRLNLTVPLYSACMCRSG
jgi:hypothetical protein